MVKNRQNRPKSGFKTDPKNSPKSPKMVKTVKKSGRILTKNARAIWEKVQFEDRLALYLEPDFGTPGSLPFGQK